MLVFTHEDELYNKTEIINFKAASAAINHTDVTAGEVERGAWVQHSNVIQHRMKE